MKIRLTYSGFAVVAILVGTATFANAQQPPRYGPSLTTGAYAPTYGNGPLAGTFIGPNAFFQPNIPGGLPSNANPGTGIGGLILPQANAPTTAYTNYSLIMPPKSGPGNSHLPTVTSGPIGNTLTGMGSLPASNAALFGRAQFTVKLPADARLVVEGVPTKMTGASRRFHSPATLENGKTYEYTFRAEWPADGKTITEDRSVRFKVGDDLTVDFAAKKATETIQPSKTP